MSILKQNIGDFSKCYSCKNECKGKSYALNFVNYEKDVKFATYVFAGKDKRNLLRACFVMFCEECWIKTAGKEFCFEGNIYEKI